MEELIEITTASWSQWLFVSTRILGALMILPFFSVAQIPFRLRIAFAVLLALVVAPMGVTEAPSPHLIGSPITAIVGLLGEFTLGWILGGVIALLIWGTRLAATWIGATIGSPGLESGIENSEQESPLATLFTLMATLIFIALDGHRLIMLTLLSSFQKVPAGLFSSVVLGTNETATGAIDPVSGFVSVAGSQSWLIGLELALPAVLAILLITLILGIAARTIPELDIFFTGFALRTSVGFIALFLTLPFIADAFALVVEMGLQGTDLILNGLVGG
ncbi:MAG: hypothetical protein GWP41_06525 [Planctomycetia bacterium]|nr:hypothetical protein [Planctomycetia bacterium]